MAYNFDGVDDVITATITAVDTGDWTICAWVYPETRGELNQGSIFRVSTGAAVTRQALALTSSGMSTTQAYPSPTCIAIASSVPTLNSWSFVCGTFNSSTVHCALYLGTLTTAVEALSLSTDTAGGGSRSTAGTSVTIGNNPDTTTTFDGSIEHAFFFKRLLSTTEMEAIRLGRRPAPDTTNLVCYYPLTADAKDRSGNGADGTVTGAVLASGFAPQLPSAPVSATSLTATAAPSDSLTLTPA